MRRTRVPKAPAFFIAVNPVGSLFAKTVADALKGAAQGLRVLRVDHQKGQQRLAQGKKVFFVTTNPKDKIEQFRAFSQAGVSCPRFATTVHDARAIECKTLFARTLINSTNGRGIVEFEASAEQYPHAPLYTEYIPKKAEYRLHVFNGVVIDVQQKRKKRDFNGEDRDTRVRNLANGYVYTRNDVSPPDGINDLAIRAVRSLGYLYGAVDIIYNEKRNQCFVLEVNSRPGLMGATIGSYVNAIKATFNLN